MRFLNKSIALTIILSVVFLASCEDGLEVNNPNEPTPSVLLTESGIERQSLGLWNVSGGSTEWVIWHLRESLGDNIVAPWGNFNWGTYVQPAQRIEWSNGDVTEVRANRGQARTQEEAIDFINNDRTQLDISLNGTWEVGYAQINEANLILQALDRGVEFRLNDQAKQSAYRAWANFWKAFSYTQIGLFYEEGLIVNEPGESNNNFLPNDDLIAESNRLYDLALQGAGNFDAISNNVVPGFFPTNITSASFAQIINTLKARNILMSKRKVDITNAEWQEIKTLTENGLENNSGTLLFDSDESTFLTAITERWRLATNLWARVSPRVVQIAMENQNDARANFFSFSPSGFFDNNTVTQFINSPWATADPSPYASSQAGTTPQYYVSAEENLLMQAEAELALGSPGVAGGLIDDARALQNAGMAPVGNATFEDIRRERKLGLFMRGLAFYDARRLGELDSKEEGGGVKDVWVYRVDPATSSAANNRDDNTDIFYDFVDYFPVPSSETDFNVPSDSEPQM